MSQKVLGRITNYRIGIRTQQSKECLIEFNESSVGTLVGKKVVWTDGKSRFTGKIMGLHGKNGVVRAKFAHPVPGQAIGKTVELVA